MKKVLVTGAGGFIGSRLTEVLAREGFHVKAMCHYNSLGRMGWLEDLPLDIAGEIETVAGDVRDPYTVRSAVHSVDVIFHLAALIGIPYSYISPDSYIDTNIKGTLNILQAGRDSGVEQILLTSTSEVYGTARYVPIDEEHPVQGQSPYSASKIGADQLAISFYRSFGTPISIIRPFNTYGPRQSARAIIPTIVSQILGGSALIRLGAIHPSRDMTFVDDTVKGFLASSQSECAIGEVINLGTGFEITMRDLAALIAEIMGKEISVVQEGSRIRPDKSEVERLCADNSKARKLLGWAPEYSGLNGLRKGLTRTIEWFSRQCQSRLCKWSDYHV